MILNRRRLLATGAGLFLGSGSLALWSGKAAAQELTVDAVLNDPDAPVLGNPDGDVTVVEYFDYQCPYCKSMHPVLEEVLAQDGGLRLVMKDWPIFGAASVRASQLALGALSLDRYEPVHAALMATKGRLTTPEVDAAVAPALAVEDALNAYRSNRRKWDGLLHRNNFQATALGFRGTPAFAVETTLYSGALDRRSLLDAIAEARAGA